MTQVERLKIFLASPSDVARERKYAQDVIQEINRVFAPSRGTVLDLITSERARPGYGKDGQAIINEQIGNMEEYDLFVGIMWNRIGTRTPRDISGTVEEFARAAKAAQRKQKPEIWFYFRQAPANLTTKDELAQREGVLEFRKKLRGKSLFRDYKTPLDFSNQLREHLLGWLEARSQKGSPGSGKTRRRPSDNGSNSVSSARIDRSKRPGDATNLKAALGMRKPAGKAPVKRAPAVTKNPGTWIMLDDHFFRTQSSNLEADRSIVLRIAPTSQGQTADLRSLHAGDLHRRREVPYADEHEAGITQVQSVTSQTSRGKTIFTVTLAPLPQLNRRGALSEFSYNSYSANTIAELRARWILLGQPLPKEIEHLAVSHQGRSVYRATGDLSIQTLPQLWASLGTQTQAFLPRAWLYAAYLLKTENIVENILSLELGPVKNKVMQVKLSGRRVKIYDNREPVTITVEGECSLES